MENRTFRKCPLLIPHRRIPATLLAIAAFILLVQASASGGPDLQNMRVAITVDDLPAHGDLLPGVTRLRITQGILRALKKNGLTKVYAFANGTDAVGNSDALRALKEWQRAGFPVANHTFSHSDLDQVGTENYLSDIQRMHTLLTELEPFSFGRKDFLFRYPFLHEGVTVEQREAVRKFLFANNYRIAEVTVDWGDWAWGDAYTRCVRRHDDKSIAWLEQQVILAAELQLINSRRAAKTLFNRDIAHIVMLHDSMFNATVLDSILRDMHRHGVKMIPLGSALEDPVYQIDTGVTPNDGATFLTRVAEARSIKIAAGQNAAYLPISLTSICQE
jgi:peptidoglycan/xylan/chitin deacetylase (PgdA/CDA1 family)